MTILCIDPVKSLLEFAEIAARQGHHILVCKADSSDVSLDSAEYESIDLATLDDTQLAKVIEKKKISYAFSDSAEGYCLASKVNRIIEGLSRDSNEVPDELIAILKDKVHLAEHLRKVSPNFIFEDYEVVDNKETLMQVIAELENEDLAVIRPNRSSDDGSACFVSRGDAIPQRILDYLVDDDSENRCIVHRYIEGEAYFINGFKSSDGLVQFDVWRCIYGIAKPYGYLHSVVETRFGADRYKAIQANVVQVLSAIRLRSGPFHLEVIVAEGTFKVIKVATRLAGAPFIYFYEKRGGVNQLTSCLQAVTTDAKVNLKASDIKYTSDFSFYPPANGVLKKIHFQSDLEALTSFDGYLMFPERGQLLEACGGECGPLTVSLSHADFQILRDDIEKCLSMQSKGVFELTQ